MGQRNIKPDPEMTEAQVRLASSLSGDQLQAIDKALLSATSASWRKVSRVVGTAMLALPNRVEGLPDIYYAQRVTSLVGQGFLEHQGNLAAMRNCEVRLARETE